MERITIRGEHGIFVRPELDFGIDEKDYDLVQAILGRLAAYEDTGLEPEDLQLGLNAAGRKKAGAEYYGLTGEELDRAVELLKTIDEERSEVPPELRKAVELLRKEYEEAKQQTWVRNKVAYALYNVWKGC